MKAVSDTTQDARQESASAMVLREVVRGLYNGAYAPGQRLAEPELIEQFGVSRSTAREAIRRMEAEGLVDVLPHRGAMIRRLSLDEAMDALMVMELCVGLAARQAAERIEAGDHRKRLEDAWHDLSAFENAGEGFESIAARNRFYRTLAAISGNRELQRIIPGIHVHLIRRDYSMSARTRFDDYRKMADAILAGDAATAERVSRTHIARTAKIVRSRLA